jgi:hypothetical protein
MLLERKSECPLYREPCRQLKCEWFMKVYGTDPQDKDKTIEEWGCAVVFNVQASLQISKYVCAGSDGVQNAVESFRNETVRTNEASIEEMRRANDFNLRMIVRSATSELPRLINGSDT